MSLFEMRGWQVLWFAGFVHEFFHDFVGEGLFVEGGRSVAIVFVELYMRCFTSASSLSLSSEWLSFWMSPSSCLSCLSISSRLLSGWKW